MLSEGREEIRGGGFGGKFQSVEGGRHEHMVSLATGTDTAGFGVAVLSLVAGPASTAAVTFIKC